VKGQYHQNLGLEPQCKNVQKKSLEEWSMQFNLCWQLHLVVHL